MLIYLPFLLGVLMAVALVEGVRSFWIWFQLGRREFPESLFTGWRAFLGMLLGAFVARPVVRNDPDGSWTLALLLLGPKLLGNTLFVYDGGVKIGGMALRWSEVRGWAFGRPGQWEGEFPAVRLLAGSSGPSRLYIWTDSPWRILCWTWRQPVRVWVGYTPELEAILRRHAPELGAGQRDGEARREVVHSV